jgi:crotonobetainyl-CoA:carnitine CoA-transferase CaiB-like acyl-CoA transferase
MFKELLIIETAGVLAGPSVGMFFAELGARVIKIEPPAGDPTRQWKLQSEDPESPISAYFCSVNYGKQHRILNLKDPGSKAELDELIAKADILISNHLERQAESLGLSESHIRSVNQSIIHGHIKGFAQSDEPAFDVVLQAETGYISMTGSPGHLAKLPIAMIDILAGHQLKEGILTALLNRMETGEGAYVEVSLEEAAIAGLANQASNYLMEGAIAKPMGTMHPNIVPYGNLFNCAAGEQMLIACGSDAHFDRLCNVLQVPEISSDARFCSNQERLKHRTELHEVLQKRIEPYDRSILLDLLEKARVPAGAVRTLDQFMDGDVARSMVLESDIEGYSTKRVKGNAFRIKYFGA